MHTKALNRQNALFLSYNGLISKRYEKLRAPLRRGTPFGPPAAPDAIDHAADRRHDRFEPSLDFAKGNPKT